MDKKRICIVATTRGNYAKIKSLAKEIASSDKFENQLVIGGALVEKLYGNFRKCIQEDGLEIKGVIDYPIKGGSPFEIAQSAAIAANNTAKVFNSLNPDLVVVIADRYEALSVAQAALCMNIRIAHIEGGEISGSIDERIRHAITKMAHIHFVSNEDAKERVIKMGEKESTVHICGTPTIDIIKGLDINNTESLRKTLDQYEDGRSLSLESPYIVVSQHSVVTEYKESSENIRKTIEAIKTVEVPVVWILPNDDAGTAIIEDEVNKIKYVAGKYPIIKIRGMGIEDYSVLLYKSRCLVGNTSSGIRECSYLGVPVVNIGTRQNNRLRSANVIDVGYDVSDIKQAIKIQQEQGRFKSNELYGDGNAARKMVNVLERPWPMIDKQITY